MQDPLSRPLDVGTSDVVQLFGTAKANGLKPYAYLRNIFEKLPPAKTLADIEALLPWNVAKPTR